MQTLARLGCLLLCSGCLTYVPSRSELQRDLSSTELSNGLGGPEAFRAYERMLSERLAQLIRSRGGLVDGFGESAYALGPNDQLELTVFGLPDLSSVADVAADGYATFPLIGTVLARGLTIGELRQKVMALLKPYVKDPRFQLAIKQHGAHRVSVLGAVSKPGIYPLTRTGQTINEVLALAGGRNEKAGTRLILIPPGDAPQGAADQLQRQAHGVEIEFEELSGTIEKRPLIIPLVGGDTVIIPEAGAFKVDGEVIKAGSFPLTAKTSTLGAIAAAGGVTYSANVYEVEVIRDIGTGKKAAIALDIEKVIANGAQDVLLRDGDIVRVPSAPGKFRTRQVVEFVNGFFRMGVNSSVR